MSPTPSFSCFFLNIRNTRCLFRNLFFVSIHWTCFILTKILSLVLNHKVTHKPVTNQWGKHSLTVPICKILFSTLESNIHIFAPPCNVLYILKLHYFSGSARMTSGCAAIAFMIWYPSIEPPLKYLVIQHCCRTSPPSVKLALLSPRHYLIFLQGYGSRQASR